MRIDNYRGWDDELLPKDDASARARVPASFASTTIFGLDVSHYQNNIDWAKVKAAGASFVFIKATEGGTVTDANFTTYWKAAKAAGIPRGAYHFFRAKGPLQAQIDNFIRAMSSVERGELPPVLDVEAPEDWTQFTVAQRVDMVMGWLKAVESRLGVRPIIYINNPMTRDVLGSPDAFKNYTLWIAHYTSRPAPSVPAPWTNWKYWQYTEHGTIDGIAGEVDLNRYNGSFAEFQNHLTAVAQTSSTGFVGRLRNWFRRLRDLLGL
ncbi:MAG: glycoside hydrolase family 25 protein [Cyanobacteria bacterium SZAS LIN-2]|nr:glycoside hydrolase family 25 protein [Cyanobacteria bacterium SZAS LIN-3]MBS1997389.1 glycoside hydrolase family 25 protein [Cyanobacteria bacterium SZAS LIN-2]